MGGEQEECDLRKQHDTFSVCFVSFCGIIGTVIKTENSFVNNYTYFMKGNIKVLFVPDFKEKAVLQ